MEPVTKAFKNIDGTKLVIPPGGVSVLTYKGHLVGGPLKLWGHVFTIGLLSVVPMATVEGYLSVKVKTPEKNYTIACGFLFGYNRCNKMGIKILEDREKGDYGVDEKGSVSDISKLTHQVRKLL